MEGKLTTLEIVPIPSQPNLLGNHLVKKAKSFNNTSNLEDLDDKIGESLEILSKNQQTSYYYNITTTTETVYLIYIAFSQDDKTSISVQRATTMETKILINIPIAPNLDIIVNS
ncbi:13939_t:CDS:2 [Gigaspora margarita]|uniref:13939_t:CDS:1 n=1 Tax=Gigaspora margarita TaxID=4874 RepID=A0ABN7UQE7_GIGMA|nr:13939_t:CDS:2 [Gigaspora margarita]